MRVYIIQYSKNKRDDICDSSILECYGNKETAIEELGRIKKHNEGDGYTYYLQDYFVQPAMISQMRDRKITKEIKH